jgi:hypothetical protein
MLKSATEDTNMAQSFPNIQTLPDERNLKKPSIKLSQTFRARRSTESKISFLENQIFSEKTQQTARPKLHEKHEISDFYLSNIELKIKNCRRYSFFHFSNFPFLHSPKIPKNKTHPIGSSRPERSTILKKRESLPPNQQEKTVATICFLQTGRATSTIQIQTRTSIPYPRP